VSDLRKAAELALEALMQTTLEDVMVEVEPNAWEYKSIVAIQALRQALGPEVTPEVTPDVDNAKLDTSDRVLHKEWVGLTHDEVMCIWYENGFECMIYAKAIEAKLKEKNVPQP
jgi:hypothetical protein